MNPPLTDLSHSIDRLEMCLSSLSKEEDCYTVFEKELARLQDVLARLTDAQKGTCYYYTYKLPFSPKNRFTYWRVKDSDEALGLALSLYRTTEFHIDATNREEYQNSKHKGN